MSSTWKPSPFTAGLHVDPLHIFHPLPPDQRIVPQPTKAGSPGTQEYIFQFEDHSTANLLTSSLRRDRRVTTALYCIRHPNDQRVSVNITVRREFVGQQTEILRQHLVLLQQRLRAGESAWKAALGVWKAKTGSVASVESVASGASVASLSHGTDMEAPLPIREPTQSMDTSV